MQLSDMRTKLRKRIGNPSTTDVADTTLNEHLNTAYGEIANEFRFRKVRKLCTFDTVADQAEYGLPSDCLAVLRVRDTTNELRLEKLDDRRFAELTDTDETGEPTGYVRFRDWITLVPTPDDAYTIQLHYKADVTDLSADADEPVLPSVWHRGIVMLAAFYYYDEEGDVPKAQSAYNVYELWASKKPVEVDEEKTDFDSGVTIPSLGTTPKALDFNESD